MNATAETRFWIKAYDHYNRQSSVRDRPENVTRATYWDMIQSSDYDFIQFGAWTSEGSIVLSEYRQRLYLHSGNDYSIVDDPGRTYTPAEAKTLWEAGKVGRHSLAFGELAMFQLEAREGSPALPTSRRNHE
jgi:hypothetical protein